MRFSSMNSSIPSLLCPTSTVLILFLAAPPASPSNLHPRRAGASPFFSQTDQRVVTPQTFFFRSSCWVKKKKNLLDCLCLTASLIPTKEEEDEKEEKKRFSLLWVQQTSSRSTTHLLKLRLRNGSDDSGRKCWKLWRHWWADCRHGEDTKRAPTSGQPLATPSDSRRGK